MNMSERRPEDAPRPSGANGPAVRGFSDALADELLELVPTPVILTRVSDGRYVAVNEAFCSLVGFPREEVLARNSTDDAWADPEDRAAIIEQLRATGFVRNYPVRARDAVGNDKLGLASMRLLHLPDGPHILAVLHDATELEADRQHRLQQEADIARAQSIAHVGSWTWDLATDELWWSDELYRLFFYDPETFSGNVADAFARTHPDDMGLLEAANARALAGESGSLDYRILGPEGEVRYVHAEGRPERDEDGTIRRIVGFTQDVTEQVLLREERQQFLERLVEVQEEERRRIAADIHDDSLQVMTAVGIRLGTFAGHAQDRAHREELERLATSVQQAIDRLRRLLFELRPHALEQGGIGSALQEYLERTDDEDGWSFEVRDELGSPAPPTDVLAVAYRIAQEALTNARRHADARHVEVAIGWRDGEVELQVRDDGRGFDPRSDVAVRPGHIGLIAMRERAEQAGGRLEIESSPGRGCRVRARLPVPATDPPRSEGRGGVAADG
ncbi:MAG: PAS domain-containing protein [Actinomycetota bacterium]